jgi:hypothetical protein
VALVAELDPRIVLSLLKALRVGAQASVLPLGLCHLFQRRWLLLEGQLAEFSHQTLLGHLQLLLSLAAMLRHVLKPTS